MFRRINIDEENKLARESPNDLRRLTTESSRLVRIGLVTSVLVAGFLILDFSVTQKFDAAILAILTVSLISNTIGLLQNRKRLFELKEIGRS
jgi:hypothetical protein